MVVEKSEEEGGVRNEESEHETGARKTVSNLLLRNCNMTMNEVVQRSN